MYQIIDNIIEINEETYCFDYTISDVIMYEENYIILLEIPEYSEEINNIFCLNNRAILIWQSEDLKKRFPNFNNLLPYDYIGIKDETIYATDNFGRTYLINPQNGKIVDEYVVK